MNFYPSHEDCESYGTPGCVGYCGCASDCEYFTAKKRYLYEFSYDFEENGQTLLSAANTASFDEYKTREEFEIILLDWLKENHPNRKYIELHRFEYQIRGKGPIKSSYDGFEIIAKRVNMIPEQNCWNCKHHDKSDPFGISRYMKGEAPPKVCLENAPKPRKPGDPDWGKEYPDCTGWEAEEEI